MKRLEEIYLNPTAAKSLFEILGKLPVESLTKEQLDLVREMRDKLSSIPEQLELPL